jgi:Fe-S-cluster-containing hydrogenase component 2
VSDDRTIEKILGVPETREFKPGEVLIAEGDTSDRSLYLIRKGAVMISRQIAGKDIVYAYLPAGNYVGEMAALLEQPRTATVRAAITTEAIRIDSNTFAKLRAEVPGFREDLGRTLQKRLTEQGKAADIANPALIESFAKVGFGEATDVLLIDESLCIRCDNCEKACAETHDGISRLDREAGPTFGTLHVPTACRHCEDPHCMKDCPPDAIRRAPTGEVRIDDQLCIHCGNCADKCPYGVIQMAEPPPKQKTGLLSWLLFGIGSEPGTDRHPRAGSESGEKRPVKCDLCRALNRDPACVAACPTGAALRIHPEEFLAGSARYKI